MANVFDAVKESVTAREAAELYGLKVNRNGMAVCPFHDDKNPSLKLDKRFHCFGCQEDGDVIAFAALLFGLDRTKAALKLAQDFAVPYEYKGRGEKTERKEKPSINLELQYRKEEQRCFRLLSDYVRLLSKWETECAPQTFDEEMNPRFAEALREKEYAEYLLDVLTFGTKEEKQSLVHEIRDRLDRLEEHIAAYQPVPAQNLSPPARHAAER